MPSKTNTKQASPKTAKDGTYWVPGNKPEFQAVGLKHTEDGMIVRVRGYVAKLGHSARVSVHVPRASLEAALAYAQDDSVVAALLGDSEEE